MSQNHTKERVPGASASPGLAGRLASSSDGVDMSAEARVVDRRTVYTGPIFAIDDMLIDLPTRDGGTDRIRRQLIRHAPCVVMLVHDMTRDRYLLEREYRVGPGGFVNGLPAGLIDPGEDVAHAALRELAEETGVKPAAPEDVTIERVADCYSSEGMTDELAHVMIVRLHRFDVADTHFDDSEHVESAWVSWPELLAAHVTASNSLIAILQERLLRHVRGADDLPVGPITGGSATIGGSAADGGTAAGGAE